MATDHPQALPDRAPAEDDLGLQLNVLQTAAEQTLRTWEPFWTPFLDPLVLQEAEVRLGSLADLHLSGEGGYEGALRRRLLLQRQEAVRPDSGPPASLMGLEISGNFLFDPATTAEMREGLHLAGASPGEVGDLWLRGDRGAQGVITEALAGWLDGCLGQVRSVEVRFETRPLADLRFPPQRPPRALRTVEASLRLDAVASAGFGLSRTRMAGLIRQGALRVDWRPVSSPSQLVGPGQRIQLEGRGEVEVTSAAPTQRGRWRIELMRR
ncbi:MAG: photosystem II S4 domain protein [Cyanobacteriota bacterium]|nr:photosystem II S4 domain protein [Cyanobacteriota bacterium]